MEGTKLGTTAILVVGFASLFADGFSMASSDYLASKAEAARKKNDGQEEGPEEENPKIGAFFTFLAFILVGVVPLVPYFFVVVASSTSFIISGSARNSLESFFPLVWQSWWMMSQSGEGGLRASVLRMILLISVQLPQRFSIIWNFSCW